MSEDGLSDLEPRDDTAPLKGGRFLVAGAHGGFGAACVKALERAGAHVLGVDRDDVDITRANGADVAVRRAVEAFGGLDGIVHAVGMSGRQMGDGTVAECTDEGWEEVLRVNLTSAFRLIRAGMPVLSAGGGGSIVVIGSVLALSTDPDFDTVAYAASKAGLLGLVHSAAGSGAAANVRVNGVVVGLADTPMARRALSSPRILARLPELQPLGGQAVRPTVVASAVLWLLSGASASTTGASIPVDGGWLLR